jgi:hypothetical protein
MGMLAKFTHEQQIKKLQDQIKEVENRKVLGMIANMAKHYELKRLKNQLKSLLTHL